MRITSIEFDYAGRATFWVEGADGNIRAAQDFVTDLDGMEETVVISSQRCRWDRIAVMVRGKINRPERVTFISDDAPDGNKPPGLTEQEFHDKYGAFDELQKFIKDLKNKSLEESQRPGISANEQRVLNAECNAYDRIASKIASSIEPIRATVVK